MNEFDEIDKARFIILKKHQEIEKLRALLRERNETIDRLGGEIAVLKEQLEKPKRSKKTTASPYGEVSSDT